MSKKSSEEIAREKGIGTGEMVDGVYRPILDWTMVPGARLSEARVQDLMSFNFNGFHDLSLDDMIACHSRKGQAILWGIGFAAEKVVGEETTNKIYYELGYSVGKKGWQTFLDHFNVKVPTPAQVAWYQDMAHIFYGPHCQTYTEYTEDTCIVTRQDCFVSYPPPGMEAANKYVKPFTDGYLDAYRAITPEIEVTLQLFVTKEQMCYEADLSKYPSFQKSKRAGQPLNALIFKWKK